MHSLRPYRFALPLICFVPVLSLADEPAAVGILKNKGLTRSGRYFVTGDEATVLEKWKAARAVVAEHTASLRRKDDADLSSRNRAELEDRRAELQRNLENLNQQINLQGFQQTGNIRAAGTYLSQLISQRNMIQMNLAQISSAQQSLKAEAAPEPKTLEKETQKSLEATKAALTDVRQAVNAALKQYGVLESDASVKSALLALEKQKLGTFKLGPSPAFKTAVKALESAERSVLAKKPAAVSRKKKKSTSS